MSYVSIAAEVAAEDEIRHVTRATWIEQIEIGRLTGVSVMLILPFKDEDALQVIDRLEAALDNARSAVHLRAKARSQLSYLDGAGASVEAYRG